MSNRRPGVQHQKRDPATRGKRNEPAYVAHTASVLAETVGVSVEEIARITTENAFRIFSKMPRV